MKYTLDYTKSKLYFDMVSKRMVTVYRIIYEDGTLGGWIESEDNLSQYGECRILDEAVVIGKSAVSDNAVVRNQSEVSGNVRIKESSLVSGDAKIIGDVLIDDDTIVDGNVLLEGSIMITNGCKIYGNVTIRGDVNLMNNVEIADNVEINGVVSIMYDCHIRCNVVICSQRLMISDNITFINNVRVDCNGIITKTTIRNNVGIFGEVRMIDNVIENSVRIDPTNSIIKYSSVRNDITISQPFIFVGAEVNSYRDFAIFPHPSSAAETVTWNSSISTWLDSRELYNDKKAFTKEEREILNEYEKCIKKRNELIQ